MRVGIGTDVHPIEPGRPCWIAGLLWEGVDGCAGHSDGDVAAHALCDALLSAAGLGDVGAVFGTGAPSTRVRAASRCCRTCAGCWPRPAGRSGTPRSRSSATPRGSARAAPRRRRCCRRRSAARSSVSGTTTDGLGLTGRGEGLAAVATALLLPAA